jgi:hypothetical protein
VGKKGWKSNVSRARIQRAPVSVYTRTRTRTWVCAHNIVYVVPGRDIETPNRIGDERIKNVLVYGRALLYIIMMTSMSYRGTATGWAHGSSDGCRGEVKRGSE